MTTAPHDSHRSPLAPRLSRGRVATVAIFALFAAGAIVASTVDDRSDHVWPVVAVCAVFALLGLYVPRLGDLTAIATGETDERQRAIDLRATWFAMQVVGFVTIGGFLWEIAHDRSGTAFIVIALTGTAAYVGALLVLRQRA